MTTLDSAAVARQVTAELMAEFPPELQVQDVHGTWHAAAVGPGVLCQTTIADREAAGVITVAWDYGSNLVDCPDCRLWLARRDVNRLETNLRVERVRR